MQRYYQTLVYLYLEQILIIEVVLDSSYKIIIRKFTERSKGLVLYNIGQTQYIGLTNHHLIIYITLNDFIFLLTYIKKIMIIFQLSNQSFKTLISFGFSSILQHSDNHSIGISFFATCLIPIFIAYDSYVVFDPFEIF